MAVTVKALTLQREGKQTPHVTQLELRGQPQKPHLTCRVMLTVAPCTCRSPASAPGLRHCWPPALMATCLGPALGLRSALSPPRTQGALSRKHSSRGRHGAGGLSGFSEAEQQKEKLRVMEAACPVWLSGSRPPAGASGAASAAVPRCPCTAAGAVIDSHQPFVTGTGRCWHLASCTLCVYSVRSRHKHILGSGGRGLDCSCCPLLSKQAGLYRRSPCPDDPDRGGGGSGGVAQRLTSRGGPGACHGRRGGSPPSGPPQHRRRMSGVGAERF